MHDPKSFLENDFVQEHTKITYSHQDVPDDSIYIGAIDFSQVESRISTPLEKTHMFQYQKEMNNSSLHFRQLRLKVEEDAQKKIAEKEAKEALASSSTVPANKPKDKGKDVLDGPRKTQPSSTLEIFHREE